MIITRNICDMCGIETKDTMQRLYFSQYIKSQYANKGGFKIEITSESTDPKHNLCIKCAYKAVIVGALQAIEELGWATENETIEWEGYDRAAGSTEKDNHTEQKVDSKNSGTERPSHGVKSGRPRSHKA